MDLSELKYKISKLVFFIGSFKYRRNKNLYVSFFLIVVLISAAAFGIYLYQKNVITKKENILKSYFAELEGKSPSANAGSNNDKNSGNNSGTASGDTSAGNAADNTAGNTGAKADQGSTGSSNKNGGLNNQSVGDTGGGSQITTGDTVVKIKAYICGYVKNPGVYELESDSRIEQLLVACGGASENACLEAVNLAKKLSDGEMVYIPSIEEVAAKGGFFNYISGFIQDTFSGGDSNDSQSKIVNINIASAGELESLPGIGETIAQDIILYREKYGMFKTKEELKNVKGIGDIKFEKVKELISIQ
jgi:competence protein ComEA